ncbi:glutathione S-transferase T3-like [Helianthus annuus]|uniref:glutathione S-transferase T3-like n=1 Tax=Helianthus annuus TaxID=4232 RepID=UPI001652DB2A|nr:glutathione S-transferase T3-like [Helianthus annuus]
MEMMDIKWAFASAVRRAKDFMERTGRTSLESKKDTKYGFDKQAVKCFNCGERGHFKREYTGDDEYNVDEDADNEEDDARDKKGKMESQKWTKVQEEALAKAWVHCSTNKKKGNQQNRDSFWRKILDHYNATVGGSKRTVHQVRSKWTPMMTKINFFNGLYQQADRTRGSGCNDLNVMKVALKGFKDRYPNGFQHVEAWETPLLAGIQS